MKKEELAIMLNGRKYRDEVNTALAVEAGRSRLIIAYGSSDDLLSVAGALDSAYEDEVGARGGTEMYLTKYGELKTKYKEGRAKIKAIWSPSELKGASWLIETDQPHATFDIFEDGELFCRGVVFELPR